MAKASLKTATFRPAEIQQITGITPDAFRDFRKRGYVEETEGWTAADLMQTARLIIVSRLSAVGIPPAAMWKIARLKGAAEQVVAFALDFEGAVVDHNGRAIKAGLHLGNELSEWKLPLSPGKRHRFLCISNLEPVKTFFAKEDDAKKIYFTQREVPLLTLDLKWYGALLVDKASKPLIQIAKG